VAALVANGAKDRVKDAYTQLLQDILTGAIVTVVTTLEELPNMVLEKVEVTREAKSGTSLVLSASATQITVATLETITVTASAAGQTTTKAGGKTPTKTPPPAAETNARSGLAKVLDPLTGWLQ
jgi:hypothetical protein